MRAYSLRFLKRNLAIVFISFYPFLLLAQVPQQLSYQAVVRDADQELVRNQQINMNISIRQGTADGMAVYSENQTPMTNVNGLVSIQIGNGTVQSGDFSMIDWGNGPYFIATETDPTGGDNFTLMGTSQLLSVPYALYAENSGTPGPKGDKGDPGEQGPKGDPGDPASLPDSTLNGQLVTYDGTNWVAKQLSATITNTGANQSINNLSPYLAVNYIIALQGTFPSRNTNDPFLGEIIMFAGNFAPRGWALCDGQLLAIASNQALFSILGTIYGGDGRTTFALPDLRGRSALHAGSGPGLRTYRLGEKSGTELNTLNINQLPSHSHQIIFN